VFGGRSGAPGAAGRAFVDLDGYVEPVYAQSDARVKVVEVASHRDLRALTDMAYRGNVLVLDFSRFADGDAAKKDMSRRLREAAKDVGGAFTEASDRLMVLSPGGLGIDKCKITYRE